MTTSQTHRDMAEPIDYDLHGLAGVRLLNATPGDAAVVTRQLGPIQAPLTRMLAGKEAYAVYHPYPVVIASLFDTISPLCQEAPRPLASIARFPEAACLR